MVLCSKSCNLKVKRITEFQLFQSSKLWKSFRQVRLKTKKARIAASFLDVSQPVY